MRFQKAFRFHFHHLEPNITIFVVAAVVVKSQLTLQHAYQMVEDVRLSQTRYFFFFFEWFCIQIGINLAARLDGTVTVSDFFQLIEQAIRFLGSVYRHGYSYLIDELSFLAVEVMMAVHLNFVEMIVQKLACSNLELS